MKYFGYSDTGKNPFRLFEIHEAVQKATGIAKARYRDRYQDALDAAFFHIIDNYDESRSEGEDLEHYAARVVSTIYRSKYNKEVSSETVLEVESNAKAVKNSDLTDPYSLISISEERNFDEEVDECTKMMIPYFIRDYEIFAGKKTVERKMNYRKVFERFDIKVINRAVSNLAAYYNEAKYLADVSKSNHLRRFGPDRYKDSLDNSIVFEGIINGVVICKYSPRVKRNIYRVNLQEFIDEVVSRFYTGDDAPGKREIYGTNVYVTLSGHRLVGDDELRVTIEREIVGSLLARVISLRVVYYKEGEDLYVSSSKQDEMGHFFTLFDQDVILSMTRMVVRRVVATEC